MSNTLFMKLTEDEKRLVAKKLELSVEDIEAQIRNPDSVLSKKRNTELFNIFLHKAVMEFVAMLRAFEIFSAERLEELSLLAEQEAVTPVAVMTELKEPVQQIEASNDAIKAADRRVEYARRALVRAEEAHYQGLEGLRNDCANQLGNDLVGLDPAAQHQQIIAQIHHGFNQLRPDMARVAIQRNAEPNNAVPMALLRVRALEVFTELLSNCTRVEAQAKHTIGVMFDRFAHGYFADTRVLIKAFQDLAEAQRLRQSLTSQARRSGYDVPVSDAGNYPHPVESLHQLFHGKPMPAASAPVLEPVPQRVKLQQDAANTPRTPRNTQ